VDSAETKERKEMEEVEFDFELLFINTRCNQGTCMGRLEPIGQDHFDIEGKRYDCVILRCRRCNCRFLIPITIFPESAATPPLFSPFN
jgi:hypothetical protein